MFIFRFIQKLRVINRFNKILLVFFRAGFSLFIYKLGLGHHVHPIYRLKNQPETQESQLPRKLREVLISLGPVFVKFGQILSTRSDILPQEYTTELSKLQATVPPFSYKEAQKIIEKNLGKPVEKIFKKFPKTSFAAASLGQVYKAQLHSGEIVAVKVQRPNAKQQIKLDTEVLLMLAHLIDKHVPDAKGYNLISVVQEFRRWTLNELDYRKEATNCEIFSEFFKNDPNVYGPKVYWEYSAESVLTLEYVDGFSLGDIIKGKKKIKVNKKELAHHIADSFIRQFFEYGYFHADPHPGNLFLIKNNHLMYLDFGMVGFLDNTLTGLGSAMFLALIQKDVENIVSILLKIEANYDEKADQKDMRDIVRVNNLRKELSVLILQWSSGSQAGQFTKLFSDMLRIGVKNGVGIPTDLVMLGKSITTLDVVVKELDKDFNMQEWEQPMVEKIMQKKLAGKNLSSQLQSKGLIVEDLIKRLPASTATVIDNLERGHFGMEINPQQLVGYERLLNANSRVNSYGTLLASVLIASALIYQVKGQPEFLGLSIAQIAFYGSLALVVLYFISNLRKGKTL